LASLFPKGESSCTTTLYREDALTTTSKSDSSKIAPCLRPVSQRDSDFLARLSWQLNPDHLWVGYSDSRVPANQIIDLPPGEVFEHCNVAKILYHNDKNALPVVQFAGDDLKVKHILIVGITAAVAFVQQLPVLNTASLTTGCTRCVNCPVATPGAWQSTA
jgi:hypothetical protein